MVTLEFIGNIGKDAEIKTMQDGRQFIVFTVGATQGYGEHRQTRWVSVRMNHRDRLAEMLVKGTKVFVRGTPSFSVYNNEVSVSVWANEMEFCGGTRKDGDGEKQDGNVVKQPANVRSLPITGDFEPKEDDLPF